MAVEQFATHGLSGARVDEIARATATSKRMIYYYFDDKEGLYRAALESEYRRVREGEWELQIGGMDPVEAMRSLVRFTFDFHRENPNFVRMIMIENIHNATYLERSEVIRELNRRAVSKVEEIYDEGVAAGLFREGMSPLELHWALSAMCFYNVSNRATFSVGFGSGLFSESHQETLRDHVAEVMIRSMLTPDTIQRRRSGGGAAERPGPERIAGGLRRSG
ncbi:TetR/AcrR family transcriptional regulator [Tropicimonas sp.]|uniref:TetR/AcrR family transcriptional regulator n=1 Tax=Tropicimonas sp. TaxID=2067044 RepID=UPI003A89F6B6